MSRKVCIGYVNEYVDGSLSTVWLREEDAKKSQWGIANRRRTAIPVYIDAPPRKRKLGKKEADEWCKRHDVEIIERPCADADMRFQAYFMKGEETAFGPTRLGAIIALRKLTRGKK